MGSIKNFNKILKNIALKRGAMRINVISSHVDDGYKNFSFARKFQAFGANGRFLGSADAQFSRTSGRTWFDDINVLDKHQGKGVASELFNHIARVSKKYGNNFLWTRSNIMSKKMIKIRDHLPSKHLAFGLGKYQEGQAIVNSKTAMKMVSGQKEFVRSVSNLKSVRFVRINGRIVPIRMRNK